MAVDRNPSIRGFQVRLVDLDPPCAFDDAATEANAAVARAVVADRQNVGVIGHTCSAPFVSALTIYETAGVVTINGSATGVALPELAPTTFNRAVVNDDEDFESWYARVQSTPVNVAWRLAYEARFGSQPEDFADLYFDAATILLQRLEHVSHLDRGRLVIDRSELARAIRATRGFPGVTCSVRLDPATGNRVNDPEALEQCRRIPVVRTAGVRINLLAAPATFPAFTPFHIQHG
jgi:ABC-type branched-subunit amino acid transport system substrate-binding protein